jgi:hypothetical protein
MAFLLGIGEMIVEGLAGGIMSNIGNEVVKTFKPIVAKKVGDEIVSYSASHPKGFIAQSLESATASRYNNLNQAKKLKEKHHEEHKRKVEKLKERIKERHRDYSPEPRHYEQQYHRGHRRFRH